MPQRTRKGTKKNRTTQIILHFIRFFNKYLNLLQHLIAYQSVITPAE